MVAKSSDTPDQLPTIGLLCGDTPIRESKNTLLHCEIFDGIELAVQLLMITVFINDNNRIKTVNISPVRLISYS